MAKSDWEDLKCPWLVEVSTASLYPPEAEWYPDFADDVVTLVECGAALKQHPDYPDVEDAIICANGHERLPLEIEWAPYGPGWQREMAEAEREGF